MKHACLLLSLAFFAANACAQESGTVTPEEAWQLGWPTMQGPYGNFRAARTGAALVDDLSRARLVWESEEKGFGRAKHTTGTFKAKTPQERAQRIRDLLGPNPRATPGGWAAPIIAEGKLFASSFVPSGKLYDVTTAAYDEESKQSQATAKAYLEADDLLIALDAKTGRTIWKAAEPGGFVWGVGKRMGFQVAPVYRGGKVFSMGTTGRVFAYRTDDGKKLWETDPLAAMLEQKSKHLGDPNILQATRNYGWQQSLAFAEGVLIVPRQSTLEGLDPESGRKKWTLEKVVSRWVTPSRWRHGGREYLLCPTDGKPSEARLNLVDPVAGKILWTLDGLHATQFNLAAAEDHVLLNVGSSIIKEDANQSAPRNADNRAPFGRLGAYRLTPESARLAWKLPDEPHYLIPTWNDSHARPRAVIRDGLVYHATGGPDKERDRRFIVARLKTGEVLADHPRGNDFWFQLIEDKLLYCPDWSHGSRATFELYASAPDAFEKLSGPWKPSQPLTTSYQVFMEPPVVDGHIFLRTETGTVACYDLRKR